MAALKFDRVISRELVLVSRFMVDDARVRFLSMLHTAAAEGTLVKLTLGKYRGSDATLTNLFVRPVTLKSGPQLSFLWRHATRDITKNHPIEAGVAEIDGLLGKDFLDAHLFTASGSAQFETASDGTARLRTKTSAASPKLTPETTGAHDRAKSHLIPADAPWLQALGITNDRGQPREGMSDKFRQIQKFAELLTHLLGEAELVHPTRVSGAPPLRVVDMGSGKGYLTFAVASLLGSNANVEGIESRPELTDLCNRIAQQHGLSSRLQFRAGSIADTELSSLDVLIALHACDTATDDAIAKGIAGGAKLIVVSPCCQKEIRRQLVAPPVLAGALQHGIFQERQAEFVTDALRAQLLDWAGYRTRVFEFISTEHTAKNLMIAAIKTSDRGTPDDARARRVREFAAFYGVRQQQLATHLQFQF